MKILFVIQGEGRGHLTQALSLRQKLTDEGHQVVGVLVGKSPVRRIPSFFTEKINVPVYHFESPNFLPTAKNKQVNLLSSIGYNLLRLHKYAGSIRYIDRDDPGDGSRCGGQLLRITDGTRLSVYPSESRYDLCRSPISFPPSRLLFSEVE